MSQKAILKIRFFQGLSFLFILAIIGLILGCQKKSQESGMTLNKANVPMVVAVNYPVYWFAHYLAADFIDLRMPFPANKDPAFWRPTDKEIMSLQKADLILLSGARYAKWVAYVDFSQQQLVDCGAQLKNSFVLLAHRVTHSHGIGGSHSHGVYDSNLWLNPQHALSQIEVIYTRLTQLLPDNKEVMQARYQQLMSEFKPLFEAQANLINFLEKHEGHFTFYGSHPVYGYFSQSLNIKSTSYHWEPEEYPGATAINSLLKKVSKKAQNQTKTRSILFWEGHPLDQTQKALSKGGVESIVINTYAFKSDVNLIKGLIDNYQRLLDLLQNP